VFEYVTKAQECTDILTLFSARTADKFFFMRLPHPLLVVSCLFALCLTTSISLGWPEGYLAGVPVCGLVYDNQKIALWVWIYCIIVFFIQDIIKVITWRILMKFNIFNVNNVVKIKKPSQMRLLDDFS